LPSHLLSVSFFRRGVTARALMGHLRCLYPISPAHLSRSDDVRPLPLQWSAGI
jgi:hypothetical protein